MSAPPSSSQPGNSRIFRANTDTILPGDPRVEHLRVPWRAMSAAWAYRRALAAHRQPRARRDIGYRLYVVDADLTGEYDVWPGDGHLVVGRHTHCDVVVRDAETVSLRHVLVRASALDDGMPVVSLLDLDTSSGFELSDGSREHAVVATGPAVFRVGSHWLVALPSSGSLPEEIESPRVQRVTTSTYQLLSKSAAARTPSGHGTQITIVPRTSQLSDLGSLSLSGHKGYQIAVESSGHHAAVNVFEREVEHGILVGRAPKCLDAGLRRVLNNGVSRVHVLIIREQSGVMLYDIASTNGTFRDGRRVRRVALADAGTSVCLAGNAPLELRWRALDN